MFEDVVPVRLAHREGGNLRLGEIVRHGDLRARRAERMPGGVPAAARMVFKERVDAVECAARRRPVDEEARPAHLQTEAVFAKPSCEVRRERRRTRACRSADDDRLVGKRAVVRRDRERDARRAREAIPQLLRRVDLARARLRRAHDRVGRRPSALRQDELARRCDTPCAASRSAQERNQRG